MRIICIKCRLISRLEFFIKASESEKHVIKYNEYTAFLNFLSFILLKWVLVICLNLSYTGVSFTTLESENKCSLLAQDKYRLVLVGNVGTTI